MSRVKKLAFGSVMMASSAMNNLFVTFYLDLFVRYSKLPASYFFSGQSLYLIWNALNDPLFGFLQDSDKSSRSESLRRRLRAVRWGGIAWSAAFLFVWFPPENASSFLSGLHFVLAICLYDGFLTLVEVSHSAILSEITVDDSERAEYNSYAAALAGFGSFSSFLGQMTWDRDALFAFRSLMTIIALISGLLFWISSKVMEEGLSKDDKSATTKVARSTPSTPLVPAIEGMFTRASRFIQELQSHRNFWVFVLVSCIQSFDCAFEKSSFAILLEKLTDDTMSASTRGLIISGSFFFPWLIAMLLTEPIKRVGVYRVLLYIFFTRCVLCFFGFVHSASVSSAAPFLLVNRVSSELVCRISPLVLSDLVDEDRMIHRRKLEETRSGSVVGSQHFFTKIASSVGPMVSFLVVQSTLPTPLLRLVFATVPALCVMTQLFLWFTQFRLKGAYLDKVRAYAEGAEQMKNTQEPV